VRATVMLMSVVVDNIVGYQRTNRNHSPRNFKDDASC
jgi:hypothetical protein